MVVKLSGIEQEDAWQEDKGEFGVNPRLRWFTDYTIYLEEVDRSFPRKLFHGGKMIDIGHLGIIVCSEAFKNNPEPPYKSLVSTAFVQERFDEEALKRYLEQQLSAITVQNSKELRAELSRFLYIN